MKRFDIGAIGCCIVMACAPSLAFAQAPAPAPAAVPLVKANTTIKISEHVFVIPDERAPMVPRLSSHA